MTAVRRYAGRSGTAAPDTSSLRPDLLAVLFSRQLVTGEPLDDDFIQHLVDAVLLPALRWKSAQ
jgi:hypothetical protein